MNGAKLLLACLAVGAGLAEPATAQAAAEVASEAAPQAGRLSSALEVALLLTVLSLLPAALVSVTSFTRIVIVLSFVRRSLSTNELPPNPCLLYTSPSPRDS